MRVMVTQRPRPPSGQDRVFTTPDAVCVLDGATPIIDQEVAVEDYAEKLGLRISELLISGWANGDLKYILARGIQDVSGELDLEPGASPSSTVAIIRRNGKYLDVLVLGDTSVVVGRTGRRPAILEDRRLSQLPLPARDAYRSRLKTGSGFDPDHYSLLRGVHEDLKSVRNKPGGFYIAEAEPRAAHHAYLRRYPAAEVVWAIVATDGAFEPLRHLNIIDWSRLAANPERAQKILEKCHDWERFNDPAGVILPRAKRHDDKTLVIMRDFCEG